MSKRNDKPRWTEEMRAIARRVQSELDFRQRFPRFEERPEFARLFTIHGTKRIGWSVKEAIPALRRMRGL